MHGYIVESLQVNCVYTLHVIGPEEWDISEYMIAYLGCIHKKMQLEFTPNVLKMVIWMHYCTKLKTHNHTQLNC